MYIERLENSNMDNLGLLPQAQSICKTYRGKSFKIFFGVPARYNLAGEFEYENLTAKFDIECNRVHRYYITVFDGDIISYNDGSVYSRPSLTVYNRQRECVTHSRMRRL